MKDQQAPSTMRILHTSDWHLGQHFYGKSRAEEHKQFLSWLLNTVQQSSIDAVIVAGDIFDTGTPPSYAREIYFDFIVKLSQMNCQLVVVAGNHDSVAMLAEAKTLLKSLSVIVIPAISEQINEQVFTLNNSSGKPSAVICAIPFIRPRDVLKSKAGQSASEKQISLQQGISEHYQTLFEYAKTLAKDELPIVATGHLTTVGVTVSESVRDIYIGTLDAFPANAFPPAEYIALGHIHRSQKVAKTEHIRYSGSPIPLSFDEAEKAKSVLIASFLGDKLSSVESLAIPCFQPMLMVKTSLDKLNDDVSLKVKQVFSQYFSDDKSESQNESKKIWLDIEIESAEYLQGLQQRIEQLVADLPVEVLLVRRSKSARKLMPEQQLKVTLKELSTQDVFDERLAQLDWQSEDELARKTRLNQLFNEIIEEQSHTENSQYESKTKTLSDKQPVQVSTETNEKLSNISEQKELM